jgi:NADH-quinone oxidoreductase subunit H
MQVDSGAISGYYSYVYSLLPQSLPYVSAIAVLLAIVIFVILMSLLFSVFSYVFGWVERKIMARAQSRHGPTYVGKWGILQNLADLVKLVAKENIMPDKADKHIFPYTIPMLLALVVFALMFIPVTSGFVGINISIGLIFIFMLLSFSPILVFLTGWTSGNKFSSIAAQRSVVMLLSYEAPIILVIAAVALLSNSYDFANIVASQSSMWYIAIMPIGFIVFFIAMLAELERPPFDLREADSELIAGWLTDVSAPYYGLVLFLDYVRMFVGSLIISVLFLGGWNGPMLPQFAWMMIKVVAVAFLIIIVRATTVRMRIDRLLRLGWTYLMPLAVVNLLISFVLFVG